MRKLAHSILPRGWIGLATDHRRLLDASQDGWLRLLDGTGFLLGQESYIAETNAPARRNAIKVRLAFDPDNLPFPGARLDTRCEGETRDNAGHSPSVTSWMAPLSLHAVLRVEVECDADRDRLGAMASQLANVVLPREKIVTGGSPVLDRPSPNTETAAQTALKLPDTLDAVQGAMAMATWAVPRIDPWIDILSSALNADAEGVKRRAEVLGEPWFNLPWLLDEQQIDRGDEQAVLWWTAVSAMRSPAVEGLSASHLADRIAAAADDMGASGTVKAWALQTRRIADADQSLTCSGGHGGHAGLAVQLALLRPEPGNFRAWSGDLPKLPPAAWWAAAALCGWRHGYRALDKKFRGDPILQECLAVRALAAASQGKASDTLPGERLSLLEHRNERGRFSLYWGDIPVFSKRWHERGLWYAADLANPDTARAARKLASELGWSCLIELNNLRGKGSLFVEGRDLEVGHAPVNLAQSVDAEVAFWLSHEEFHRQLATEGGTVPRPSTDFGTHRIDPRRPWSPASDASHSPTVSGTDGADDLLGPAMRPEPISKEGDIPRIPGLVYMPNFITEEEETELLQHINGEPWNEELKRRVQHYGWRYDYGKRRVDGSMRLGELPSWANDLARKLVEKGLVPELPDQVIVNEYKGEQGIRAHIDQPESFAEHVATLSLQETWRMVFRRKGSKRKIEIPLERRSIAVLTGEARYVWTHEIPQRKRKCRNGQPVERGRRVSVTFRQVRVSTDMPS